MFSEIVPLQYASLSRRFGAFVIDGLILSVIMIIGGHLIPVLGGLIVWLFYAPILESSTLKATIGKTLLGIEVVDEIGRRITFKAALLRNLLKVISMALLFVGFIFAIFTARKQALHDLLVDTYVVYGRDEQSIPEAWVANVKQVFDSGKRYVSSAGAADDADVVTQLERLQALRDRGTLSETEFQAAKSKILGEI